MLLVAALLSIPPAIARAESEKGRWHPLENVAGCSIWNPYPRAGETATWSGACNGERAEGQGTVVRRYVEDGKRREERTTGTLIAGKFVGHQVTLYEDGTRFEGNPNGRGLLKFVNGSRYEGEFRDGEPIGPGTCTLGGRTGRCLIENRNMRWLD
jgi:hypothetical protein